MKRYDSPVYPIAPSFDTNEELDLPSTKKYLKYLEEKGSKIVMTTAGTSQYNLMTVAEVRLFNEAATTFNGQKILGIPALSTKLLKEEIRHLNSIADPSTSSILIIFPERYYNDKQVIRFFEDICEVSDLDILVHGNSLRKGSGGMYEYSKPLLKSLSKIRNFIGMKEESSTLVHSIKNIPEGLEVIVAGGSMRRFWALEPHGATTFLSGVGSFNPEWEEAFYTTYFTDIDKAKEIMTKVETPLFNTFMKEGWHLSMRTALKSLGFIQNDRAPFYNPTLEQQENIHQALNKII